MAADVAVGGGRQSVLDLARAIPNWVWLGGIVLASILARGLLGHEMPAPFIFTDELAYAELARSLADHGQFAIRDVPVGGYGPVYPATISLAYLAFDHLTDAYGAVKAINAVMMSLAAIPAFLIARRVVTGPLALLAAALTVAVPSMVYTSTVMTENAFYPAFLLAVWALLRALERPGWQSTVVLVVMLVLTLLIRVQAIALVLAALTAPLLLAAFDRGRQRLRRFVWLYGILGGGAVLVVLAQVARGRSLESLLGAYAVVGESHYDVGLALHYWLWHLEEISLSSGIVPVAAFVVLLVCVRRVPAAVRAHLAVTVAAVFWMSLVVGVFASRHAGRIQERNLFAIVPLLFIALLAWGVVRQGSWRPLETVSAVGAVVLAAVFPYARFIDTAAISDTLALLPIWSAYDSLPFGSAWGTVALFGGILAMAFVLLPRRAAIAVPVALLAVLCALSSSVWSGEHSFERAGIGALYQGIRSQPRGWIDASVPPGTPVAGIFTGFADRYTINENEFFNRSLGQIYFIGGPTPGGLPETEVHFADDGVLRRVAGGSAVTDRYVLADSSVPLVGAVVASDPAAWGMTIWRISGPVVRRAEVEITGLYPGDTWSGRHVRYVRKHCTGGALDVRLTSDEQLFGATTTTVVATVAGRAQATARFTGLTAGRLRVPLVARDDICTVDFEISPTRNPSHVLPASTDDRELGSHFDALDFIPSE